MAVASGVDTDPAQAVSTRIATAAETKMNMAVKAWLQRIADGIRMHSDLEAGTTWRADQILRELFDIGQR